MKNRINISTLEDHVRYHISNYWAEHCGSSTGHVEMPNGYALMKDIDGDFYWVKKDGTSSASYGSDDMAKRSAEVDAMGSCKW